MATQKKEVVLGRDDLLKKQKLKIKKVDLGEGEVAYVRELYGKERDEFDRSLVIEEKDESGETFMKSNLENIRAKLVALTLCNSQGKSIMTVDDAPVLAENMSAKRLALLGEASENLNRVSEEEREAVEKK